MELIPGLPNDIARQCLFRLHCTQLSALSSLSKAWKSELQSPEFWLQRKQLCNNKQLILLKCRRNFIYKLIVVEPETSIWSELPPIPELPNGLPKAFHFVVASFKWGFVVTGAFPEDYEDNKPFCNEVFAFDYISATWQRGADMPEGRISVYRSTFDHNRMVYVLCEQAFLTERIMVYDVMKDEWTSHKNTGRIHGGICDEGRTRRMIYWSRKIHYLDDSIQEGNVEDNKRVFNVTTWKWEKPERDLLDPYVYEICISDEGEWYPCRFGPLLKYKDSAWEETGQETDVLIGWMSKVMVILGRWKTIRDRNMDDCESRRFEARVLDLKNQEWSRLDGSQELRGEVEACCYVEI